MYKNTNVQKRLRSNTSNLHSDISELPKSKQPLLHLHHTVGNQVVEGLFNSSIQTKLKVGSPNDKYEREADRLAEAFVKNPLVSSYANISDNSNTNSNSQSSLAPEIQAKSIDCDKMELLVQTKFKENDTSIINTDSAEGISSLQTGGQAVPEIIRRPYELHFGRDFSQVRIHTGNAAEQASKSISARAYTLGNNIVFGSSQYQPNSLKGKRLLAHEFTHVLQQQYGRSRGCNYIQREPSSTCGENQAGFDVIQEVNNLQPTTIKNPNKIPKAYYKHPTGNDRDQIKSPKPKFQDLVSIRKLHNNTWQEVCVFKSWGAFWLYWEYLRDPKDNKNQQKDDKKNPKARSKAKSSSKKKSKLPEDNVFHNAVKLKLILLDRPARKKKKLRRAWKKRLRKLMWNVPRKKAERLWLRIKPSSSDDLGILYNRKVKGKTLRAELYDLLHKVDLSFGRIQRGEFKKVLWSLGGMSMRRMLTRLQTFENTDLEALMDHIEDANPLGERSKNRIAAAIGVTYMARTGITPNRLDGLDKAIEAAKLPKGQEQSVRAILPDNPTGHAERIDKYFKLKEIVGNKKSHAKTGLEGIAVENTYWLLKRLSPDDLEKTLGLIAKSQLKSLMMHSKLAEEYGELKADDLRRALYVAWRTRFPGEPAEYDVGKEENPILKMSIGAKYSEALSRSIDMLPKQGAERIKELLTPEAIATMVLFAAAFVISQTTPIGWLADILIAGMIAATILMVGNEAIEIVKMLILFSEKVNNASSDKDLDEAAELFAMAVSKVGIDIVMAILFRKVAKSANLRPPRGRSPGIAQVFKKGGGLVKTTIAAPKTAGYLVTAEGQTFFPKPPRSILMAEAVKPNAPKGGVGTGKRANSLPGTKTPVKTPKSQGLAAAEGVAKKKPKGVNELIEDASDIGAKKKSTKAKSSKKARPIDPNVKVLLNQIQTHRDVKTRIVNEIAELNRRNKQKLTKKQKDDIRTEKENLAKEFNDRSELQIELQKKIDKFNVTTYDRARSYSYSDRAGEHVAKRARGKDEMSGKELESPSVDHVVSIKEIVDMPGFKGLTLDNQKIVLSMVENLRMMEFNLNSSKGNKRWKNWHTGKSHYGKTVWERMVKLEGELRIKIQQQINSLK